MTWNKEELASLHNDIWYLRVQSGKGVQPQVPGSGARLSIATPNSPSTVSCRPATTQHLLVVQAGNLIIRTIDQS